MKAINYKKLNNNDPVTLTIGNFDGVHKGHQKLVELNVSFKDSKNVVMTFDPHPVSVFTKNAFYTLSNNQQKTEILKSLGIDEVWIIEFNKTFSQLSVEAFIDFLKKNHVIRMVVGEDFRFGYQGKGRIDDLKKYFEVVVLSDQIVDQMRISSSHVRNLLIEGNIAHANELLSRPYAIEGIVIHGDKVGRTIGFPTANIDYENYLLPKNGIYYGKIHIEEKIYDGLINIGNNPTINYQVKKRFEVYILDFNETIYGKRVKIELLKYLRPEAKFNSKEELIQQMEKDKEQALLLREANLWYNECIKGNVR